MPGLTSNGCTRSVAITEPLGKSGPVNRRKSAVKYRAAGSPFRRLFNGAATQSGRTRVRPRLRAGGGAAPALFGDWQRMKSDLDGH